MTAPFVLFAEEAQLLKERCDDLQRAAYARAVFLIDRDGQLITTSGESERFDSTSLASLTAGKVAATDGAGSSTRSAPAVARLSAGARSQIKQPCQRKRARAPLSQLPQDCETMARRAHSLASGSAAIGA